MTQELEEVFSDKENKLVLEELLKEHKREKSLSRVASICIRLTPLMMAVEIADIFNIAIENKFIASLGAAYVTLSASLFLKSTYSKCVNTIDLRFYNAEKNIRDYNERLRKIA